MRLFNSSYFMKFPIHQLTKVVGSPQMHSWKSCHFTFKTLWNNCVKIWSHRTLMWPSSHVWYSTLVRQFTVCSNTKSGNHLCWLSLREGSGHTDVTTITDTFHDPYWRTFILFSPCFPQAAPWQQNVSLFQKCNSVNLSLRLSSTTENIP